MEDQHEGASSTMGVAIATICCYAIICRKLGLGPNKKLNWLTKLGDTTYSSCVYKPPRSKLISLIWFPAYNVTLLACYVTVDVCLSSNLISYLLA